MDQKTKRTIQGFIVFTAVVILAVIHFDSFIRIGVYGVSVLMPFIIGGIIAFILNIPMSVIEKRVFCNAKGRMKKIARSVSIVMTFFLFIAVLSLISFLIVPQITAAVREQELAVRIPRFINDSLLKLQQWLAQYPELQEKITELQQMKVDWDEVFTKVSDFLGSGVGSSVLESTFNIAGSIVGGIFNGLIAIVFSIYILASKETLARQLKKLLLTFAKPDFSSGVLKVLTVLSDCFHKFITGQFLEAVILGCMFFVVLTVGRFPYAVMISLLIGVMALVPIVGAFVGCFVGAFLILMENPMQAVWFVIIFLVLQQIEGNLIYPKVVGSSVGLPSIWVLVAVTVGGSLFGVAGMLTFIPLLSTVYTLLKERVGREPVNGRICKAANEKTDEKIKGKTENKTRKEIKGNTETQTGSRAGEKAEDKTGGKAEVKAENKTAEKTEQRNKQKRKRNEK